MRTEERGPRFSCISQSVPNAKSSLRYIWSSTLSWRICVVDMNVTKPQIRIATKFRTLLVVILMSQDVLVHGSGRNNGLNKYIHLNLRLHPGFLLRFLARQIRTDWDDFYYETIYVTCYTFVLVLAKSASEFFSPILTVQPETFSSA